MHSQSDRGQDAAAESRFPGQGFVRLLVERGPLGLEVALLLRELRGLLLEVERALPVVALALVLLLLTVAVLLERGDLAAAGLELVKLEQDLALLSGI